jgi:hypothetical protein
MSISSSSPLRRSSFRTVSARLGHGAVRRDRPFVDRNTLPADFVLRDYRHVR